jgi:hypothetical protein
MVAGFVAMFLLDQSQHGVVGPPIMQSLKVACFGLITDTVSCVLGADSKGLPHWAPGAVMVAGFVTMLLLDQLQHGAKGGHVHSHMRRDHDSDPEEGPSRRRLSSATHGVRSPLSVSVFVPVPLPDCMCGAQGREVVHAPNVWTRAGSRP